MTILNDVHQSGAALVARDTTPAQAQEVLAALLASPDQHAAVVKALCALATDADPEARRRGQQVLFSTVAESLGDAFDPQRVAVHDSVFAHVIDECRHVPGGAQLDARLSRLGIADRDGILRRKATLTPTAPMSEAARARITKAFVLSRITLGADVAVTSIALQAAAVAFPKAERYLVGPASVWPLLDGLSGARLLQQSYDKSGLLERLMSWHELTDALARETAGLADTEYVVIDPDSRLTQLGLLPVVGAAVPYLFFPSRAYQADGADTLGALTAHWLRRALGCVEINALRPRLVVPMADKRRAELLVEALRRAGREFVVAVNLGVGGNARKRIPGDFELDLVRGLLKEGSAVVLDHGAGEDEARVRDIVDALKGDGRKVWHVDGANGGFQGGAESTHGAELVPADCEVMAYTGAVGPFAALAGASDLYVGYDSAFQHIAAAQGTPVVDIFVEPPSPLFPLRWRPYALGVTAVETTPDPSGYRIALATALVVHRRARAAAQR